MMDKKAWLEAALLKIDSMPRDEFLTAMQQCGALTDDFVERSADDGEGLLFVVNDLVVDPVISNPWESDFTMDDGYQSFASSTAAPQEALYFLLAA